MNKLIIFDFDGVIADTEAYYPEIHISFFKKFNVPFTEPEVRAMAGRSLLSIMTEMKERFAIPDSAEDLKSANIEHIFNFFNSTRVPLIKGLPTLLSYLKNNNINFCIASSNSRPIIETILKQHGLSDFFPTIISGDQVTEGKPNPEIFLLAAKTMHYSPEHCIVIEDTFNGVKAAKAANMTCIGYKNPNTGNQDLAAADYLTEDGLESCISIINKT